jgi:hypothetical protein
MCGSAFSWGVHCCCNWLIFRLSSSLVSGVSKNSVPTFYISAAHFVFHFLFSFASSRLCFAEKTNNDWHPDAAANRLKASLVILHSGEKCPWRIREEYTAYLSKAGLVSNACRLSVDEELYLLNWLKGGGDYESEIAEAKGGEDELAYKSQFLETELGNRLSYLTVLTEEKSEAERRAREGLTAGGDSKVAAQRSALLRDERTAFLQNKLIRGENTLWDVVEEKTTEFYKGYTKANSTWNARVEYVRPADDACVNGGAVRTLNGLWKDTITGAARQLGLYYIYELFTGRVLCPFVCAAVFSWAVG